MQRAEPTKTCRGPACNRPVIARGACRGHYLQDLHGEKLRPIAVRQKAGAFEVVLFTRAPRALLARLDSYCRRETPPISRAKAVVQILGAVLPGGRRK